MRTLMLLLIPLALLMTSCDDWVSDSEDVSEERITEIFDSIEEKFVNHDNVNEIMAYYSDDYLHDGDGLMMAEIAWEIRWGEYVSMDIKNLEIEVNGDDATATFELHFLGSGGEDIFLEPYDHGDLSYFHKENGYWKIYGNQNPGEGNNLHVNSAPQGARIYIDNAFMHQYTPATLHSVPDGQHTLRLYKAGWNELEISLDVTETQQLNYTLSTPDWPHPVFDIDSPVDGAQTTAPTTPVDAIVEIGDSNGLTYDFDGAYVIISVNGNETVAGTSGLLHTDVALQEGENEVQLRATGASGQTGVSDIIKVTRL